MCGIAGYFITDPTLVSAQGLWSLSRCLLVGIQSRGRDAAGYAYITPEGRTNFAKSPIDAKNFIKVPGHLLYEPPKEMPTNLLLHARYATQGSPTNNQNNHPLYSKISGLCMIHNGWLVNDSEVKEQFSLKPDAEVDTEIYLRLIEKFYFEGDIKTIETAIKEATKCIFGAVACAMIQGGKPNIMWLWRDSGDLYVVHTEWGYVFASTSSILFNALGCLSAFDLATYKRFYVPPSTLVQFELNKKPRLVSLTPIEWNASKYASDVYTTQINGEQKIRRVKKSSGSGSTYHYDNSAQNYQNHFYGTHFNGYNSNKGYYLSGPSENKSGNSNDRTKTPTNQKGPKRPENHHHQCCCKLCLEYWQTQVNINCYD